MSSTLTGVQPEAIPRQRGHTGACAEQNQPNPLDAMNSPDRPVGWTGLLLLAAALSFIAVITLVKAAEA